MTIVDASETLTLKLHDYLRELQKDGHPDFSLKQL
jgi:hypothetical protein